MLENMLLLLLFYAIYIPYKDDIKNNGIAINTKDISVLLNMDYDSVEK